MTKEEDFVESLIETDFPLHEVSSQSVREKSIRHGHISTLHTWWARRPLAASRSTIYAALTPDPGNQRQREERLKFLAEMSDWNNSLNGVMIERARRDILSANKGRPPRVLDPFAGGGSIPLEALRLGCETYASDLNPIAVLIEKAILEFPQRYRDTNPTDGMASEESTNRLLADFRVWAEWVYSEAKKELAHYYPSDESGDVPVGYIWSRTVVCNNPSCLSEIPLVHHTWLANKPERKIAFRLLPEGKKGWKVEIVSGKQAENIADKGTVARAKAVCFHCNSALDDKEVRSQFQNGKARESMLVVVLNNPHRQGKVYRPASKTDMAAFQAAKLSLVAKVKHLEDKWGMSPVPNEPTPVGGGTGAERAFSIFRYGMTTWGDLFNARQKLAALTFVEKIREAEGLIRAEYKDDEYSKAVSTYLALLVDRLVDKNSNLVLYNSVGEKVEHVFGRQTLGMIWDFVELNPFTEVGWHNMEEWILMVLDHCLRIPNIVGSTEARVKIPSVTQTSALSLPYPNGFFDAVITDPPYYDNVPYSYLSDFFYVWLRRSIGHLYPDLFSTPLTPKSEEVVVYSIGEKGWDGGKEFFERMLTKAFNEMYRVLKPDGIVVIVFAHKTTAAWETVIRGLLSSGLYLTASWPINTEREGRLRSIESAALASSIYMVCRKRTEEKSIYFNELKEEINKNINMKLEYFWNHDIRGSDFFVSAIGPAVEVFGKYSKVEKLSGEPVTVAELLEYVQKLVSEYALRRVLKTTDLGGIEGSSRFYLLWRWVFNNSRVQFDEARKLSQNIGVELTDLWSGGFVRKDKEFVLVLDPFERSKDPSFMKQDKHVQIIDALQYSLILWEKGQRDKLQKYLDESGWSSNDVFRQYAQALSEVLPEGDKEKIALQGFLYGFKSLVASEKPVTLLDYSGEKS